MKTIQIHPDDLGMMIRHLERAHNITKTCKSSEYVHGYCESVIECILRDLKRYAEEAK